MAELGTPIQVRSVGPWSFSARRGFDSIHLNIIRLLETVNLAISRGVFILVIIYVTEESRILRKRLKKHINQTYTEKAKMMLSDTLQAIWESAGKVWDTDELGFPLL